LLKQVASQKTASTSASKKRKIHSKHKLDEEDEAEFDEDFDDILSDTGADEDVDLNEDSAPRNSGQFSVRTWDDEVAVANSSSHKAREFKHSALYGKRIRREDSKATLSNKTKQEHVKR